ncbi:MAG: AraC family transcriptional regulator [Pseudomonadota bacterium]
MNPSALSDILSSLQVSGQVLLVDEYQPPWGIDIPAGKQLSSALAMPSRTKIVPFHIVRRGSFELHTAEQDPMIIRAGEVAICTGSCQHQMIQGEPDRIVPFADLLSSCMNPIAESGIGGSTELVCGVFMWRNTERNPLIDALPRILHTDVSGRDGGKTMELLTQLLVSELRLTGAGHDYMASRFVELLCAESIRQYLDRHAHDHPGWFRAMNDSKIGLALNAIHAAPDSELSVATLAAGVNMSTSRFAARFREVLGESVMSYATGWRMNIAGRLLVDTTRNIEQIAHQVGYQSTASFSRAFSRSYGASPAKYRKSNRASNE